MPKLGDPIRLNLQLFDGAEDKFVRAWLLDDGGALLTSLSLPHQAHGLYANKSFLMPNTPQVKAVYRVYLDSLFSNPSLIHSDAIDVFELDFGAQQATDIVGYIETDLVLNGYLEMNDISGTVFLDLPLDGILETDGVLAGELDICNTLIGEYVEEDLIGQISCCKDC